ncbi:MAG: hypothetical protein M3Q44_03135 [bacterium]|nr:hypothetical protein [bacterium]
MNTQDFTQFEPVPYLLEKAKETDIPLIYLNKIPNIDPNLPTVFLLIGPSGSGKDAISDSLYKSDHIIRATTATSRARRMDENEPEERHIWMRVQRKDETLEEYDAHLISEYGLVEHDRHFGGLYGLPYSSLESALSRGIPLVRTEVKGVKTIVNFLKGKMNCVVVFIVAESFSQIWDRISTRNNIEERKETALSEVKEAPHTSNYYLFNPELYNGKPGLPQAQEALRQLIMLYSEHGDKKTTNSY